MPGLTLNTEAVTGSRAPQHQQHQQHSPAGRSAAAGNSNSNGNPPTRTLQSTTPIPVPIPYTSRELQQQQQQQQHQQRQQQQQQPPAPMLASASTAAAAQPSPSRSSSPARPTYSPITPPLNATAFPPAQLTRPTYAHSSHADAVAAPPPAPAPIDFDSNPDVLALKSAISILQMQRRKAERDMATLDRVKRAALAEPEAFVRDLTAGRVRVEGEGLFVSGVKDEDEDDEDDEDDDSDSSSDSDGEKGRPSHDDNEATRHIKSDPSVQPQLQPQPHAQARPPQASTSGGEGPGNNIKADPDAAGPGPGWSRGDSRGSEPPPWVQIPKPQNVVRCPPINWAQYAVVGESLDKLHQDQLRRPAQGAPATVTPEGRFEFRGAGGDGNRREPPYVGVAAPYAPGKDKIDRKGKLPPKR